MDNPTIYESDPNLFNAILKDDHTLANEIHSHSKHLFTSQLFSKLLEVSYGKGALFVLEKLENPIISRRDLERAFESDFVAIFKFIGENKILVFDFNVDFWMLKLSVKKGSQEVFEYFIRLGCGLNSELKDILIKTIMKYGRISMLKFLIEEGLGINESLMELACESSRVDIVTHILSLTAFDDISHFIRHTSSLDIVKILVNLGADICFDNDDLFLRAVVDKKIDIIKFCLENGTDLTKPNHFMKIACTMGSDEICKILIDNGCQINCDLTMLMINAIASHEEIYFLLDRMRTEPIMESTLQSHILRSLEHKNHTIFKHLITNNMEYFEVEKYNLIADIIGTEDTTALIEFILSLGFEFDLDILVDIAAYLDNFPVLIFLHKLGGDLLIDDFYVLRMASHNGNLSMVKYLMELGADQTLDPRPDPLDYRNMPNAVLSSIINGNFEIFQYFYSKINSGNEFWLGILKKARELPRFNVVHFLENEGFR